MIKKFEFQLQMFVDEGEFSFDIQIFQQLPLFIRHRVLKEAKVLFVRNEELLYELDE